MRPQRSLISLALSLIVLLAIFVSATNFGILFESQYFHADEGLNLMKAFLLSEGFELYTQIWSDQPPLLTQIFSWFGLLAKDSVPAYRLLVCLTFILSFALLTTQLRARYSSLISFGMLFALWLSPETIDFAMLANVGIPSISFAIVSILLFSKSNNSTAIDLPLINSALMISLAITTKIWAVIVFFAIVAQILYDSRRTERLRRTFYFSSIATAAVAFILCAYSIDIELTLKQLILPHYDLSSSSNYESMYERICRSSIIYCAIGAGISSLLLFGFREKYLLPAFWYFISLAFLLRHRPSWEHHLMMIQIPAAILFAMTLHMFASNLQHARYLRSLLFFLPLPLYLFYYLQNVNVSLHYTNTESRYRKVNIELLSQIQRYGSPQHFLFTDYPYIAFLLQRPVPPELAVFSEKRLKSGHLKVTQIASLLKKYDVETIWLRRFTGSLSRALIGLLNNEDIDYKRIYSKKPDLIYVHRDAFPAKTDITFESPSDFSDVLHRCENCNVMVDHENRIVQEGNSSARFTFSKENTSQPLARLHIPFQQQLSQFNKASSRWLRFSVYFPNETLRRGKVALTLKHSRNDQEIIEESIEILHDRAVSLSTAPRNASTSPIGDVELADRWLTFTIQLHNGEHYFKIWMNSLLLKAGRLYNLHELPTLNASFSTDGENTLYLDGIYTGAYPSSIRVSDKLLNMNTSRLTSDNTRNQDFFPAYPQDVRLFQSTITVPEGEVFDGEGALYHWTGPGICNQTEDQMPGFVLEKGSVLKNVFLSNLPDGVHLKGDDTTVENVHFLTICEDAITIEDGSNFNITESQFYNCADKAIQINGGKNITISNNSFYNCVHPIRSAHPLTNTIKNSYANQNYFWKVIYKVRDR